MRIVVVGAGHVGQTALRSLYEDHDCTVVDVRGSRVEAMSRAFDVRAVTGSGARPETMEEAGVGDADLVLACTARDEVNLVAAMLARRLAPDARTVVRVREMDYVAAWHRGELDVDFAVSSELETANAVKRKLGVPGARQADLFVGGEVQVLTFDVPRERPPRFAGRPRSRAGLPEDSRVVAILRDGRSVPVTDDEALEPGDRVIAMASPGAAREWSRLLSDEEAARDVALFGAGRTGVAIARALLERGTRVRVIEADAGRARLVAELLPEARVFNATGLDAGFLVSEGIGRAGAAVFAAGDDSRNLHAAVLAKLHGVPVTIAVLEEPAAAEVFDAAGVDATIDPGDETAELMVRFAADPRTRQVAMLEDDRFEVLDVEVDRASAKVKSQGAVVGAIVRDGRVLFPAGEPELRSGDRAIVLAETDRATAVERAL